MYYVSYSSTTQFPDFRTRNTYVHIHYQAGEKTKENRNGTLWCNFELYQVLRCHGLEMYLLYIAYPESLWRGGRGTGRRCGRCRTLGLLQDAHQRRVCH